MARDTIKSLTGTVKFVNEKLTRAEQERDRERSTRVAQDAELKQIKMDFADLKIRLHSAETSNQFMRGYLARVQEDDVVREDLIMTGEPDGEQHMLPKRKPASFPRPDDFSMPAHTDEYGRFMGDTDRRKKARHWITY